MKNKTTLILLGVILVISLFLRFYKLTEAPPSISWDEAAVGYNAWTILNWGADEWGARFPLVFKSFEDFKHPVHIYLTAPFIALFGLTDLGVRASSAFFGVLNVALIFFLARKLFKSDLAGLLAGSFLAASPYNIHFSRFNHELNFAIFFLMLGIFLILKGIKEKKYLVTVGFGSLGLDLLTYHSAKVVVPITTLSLIAFYWKDLWKIKKHFLFGVAAFLVFASALLIEPELLGGARLKQTSSPQDRKIEIIAQKYLEHFSLNYLFLQGDSNPRLSPQTGNFHALDAPFLLVGIAASVFFIFKSRKREYMLILLIALISPIPASISSEAPHAGRAMFMIVPWYLLVALGALTITNTLKTKTLQTLFLSITFVVIGVLTWKYMDNYLNNYANRYAIEWQYGMKDIVEHVKEHPEYDTVYMTDVRQEPYIFYLFYLRTPLPSYLQSVRHNDTLSRPANTIAGFGRYNFGLWDPIESLPIPNVAYIVTPSHYTGLRHKASFDTVKEVKYPNGLDAFFIVTKAQDLNQ